MMELRQIRYAEAVAECSSFSKAAESLYVTQQTLSQQIKRLEEEIGFYIFERSTRSVALTNKGKTFIEHARPLLNAYETFSREVESLKDEADQNIRLGILPTFSHLSILETIYEFQAHEKGISVQVQIQKSSRLVDMVLHGNLDAAIGNLSQQQIDRMSGDYIINGFSKDHICAILNQNHPLAQKKELQFSELTGQTLILLEKGSSIRTRVEAVLNEKSIKPARIVDCPEIHSMIGILNSGTGIGFLSTRVALQSGSASLKILPALPQLETVTALFYERENRKNSALSKLANYFGAAEKDETYKK